MSTRGLLVVLPAICSLFCTPRVQALGIRVLHQDPEATARGEAFTATADRPSAIYYNPAGITQLEGSQLQLGTYHIMVNATHRAPGTGEFSDTPDRVQTIAQIFYTRTLAIAQATVGLGIYSPYGLGSQWPDESPFRTYATKSQLQFVSINPVIAFKLRGNLSVAAGLTANYGHADLRRGIAFPGDELRVDAEGWSYGFTAGLLWQPAPEHSFGLMYRSASHMNFEGSAHVQSDIPLPLRNGRASFEFDFPQHVMFGYSFRPTINWNLEFNADWTDWEDVGAVRFRLPSGDATQIFDWRSAWTYKVGATLKFANGFSVSAGYFFGESATPDRNFNPAIPNIDLHVFSLGFTYRTEQWSLGLTYNLGYGPETEVRGSQPSLAGQSADGKYDFIGHGLSFAAGWQF